MRIKEGKEAAALAALYNNAQPQGMGFLHYTPKLMTEEEAEQVLKEQGPYFDYLRGRVMKIGIKAGEIDTRLYDRDNGQGTAELALQRADCLE